ncbi:hypothetical protein CR513_17754, partial [Mucuna pruriens]
MGPNLKAQDATPLGQEKINSLEERVRLIEGTGGHGLDATDLCLMSDVALPIDFKTPKFEKYKGSSCPRVHLAILIGAALNWYVNLEKRQVKTWRGLAEAIVRQYK